MSGPLPNPQRRRRNAPTVPTTSLPASGRRGRPPNPPKPYEFRDPAAAWWRWAWSTPQAAAWDAGALYAAARRAQLEDDLAALTGMVDETELGELLGVEENEAIRMLGFVIGRLRSLAGGRVSVMKEMRELDKRLGLDPKALAELRWSIVADDAAAAAARPAEKPKVRRLRAV